MGGTASTRRVTFEADENENITVVKGIRVSAVGGRRAAFELGSQRRDVPGTAAPAFSALGPPCCPARSLGLWEEARSFKTRNFHSEKSSWLCARSHALCWGGGARSPQSSLLTSCRILLKLLFHCASVCAYCTGAEPFFSAHLSLSE